MQRAFFTLLLLILLLCACSSGPAASSSISPSPTQAPSALPPTAVTPHNNQPDEPSAVITAGPQSSQDCGYQWSNQDLPELSSNFQQAIQALQAEAQANAYAFGENCVRADGSIASFAAMETDFNVTLHVDDLANQSVLGRWIVQVMQVIEDIPAGQIAGSRPGRVSIVFQSSTAQSVINFYVNQYQELPTGLGHEGVYQALQALQ